MRGGTGGEFHASGSRIELIKAQIKGILDGIGGIKRMFRKRRQLMKRRRISMSSFSLLLGNYRITFKELLDHD